MTISPGTRLGPYEIVAPIGAGGMGEVYRALDTRLDRQVAVKILPAEFAQNAQRKIRFEREAKTISHLSHPNICTLFDVGENYIVMELLEGESLADRLARGPLPLSEFLKYGAQIAEALGKAHREGIVHRDLKPGNIMLTRSGAKLLDFGLAKTTTAPVAADGATVQKPLTQEGTILGTYQYMAPEQLAGEEPDARTDIFALGAILYEMATGKRAFEGKTKTSLIAAIVSGEPKPMHELQPLTPPALEHVVKKCLAKEPDDRWQSATDIAEELRWISEAGSQAGVAAPLAARRRTRERLSWMLHLVTAIVAASLTWGLVERRHKAPRAVTSTITSSAQTQFAFTFGGPPAFSPDGSRIVFAAQPAGGGRQLLYIRELSGGGAQPLTGTENAAFPFWSPDGRMIGFFAGAKLKMINASGGPAQTLCDTPVAWGGTWSRNRVIVFSRSVYGPLYKISEDGGQPVPVTRLAPGEGGHCLPSFLPDGDHFLFTSQRGSLSSPLGKNVFVGSTKGDFKATFVTAGSNAVCASGFIVYLHNRSLVAQEFNPERLVVGHNLLPIAEDADTGLGYGVFSVSNEGTLAYQSSSLSSQLHWVDASGKEVGALGKAIDHRYPSLSHDGRRIVESIFDPATGRFSLWVDDLQRGTSSRLTFGDGNQVRPIWSPDDKLIAYLSDAKGPGDLMVKRSSGTGNEEFLYENPNTKIPCDWSPEGILFEENRMGGYHLLLYSMIDHAARPLLETGMEGQFSHDGRWIAYESNVSGTTQIYVMPVSGNGGKWQISTDGGSRVRWSRDDKHIYFVASDYKLMVTDVASNGDQFASGVPRALFPINIPRMRQLGQNYDVTPHGERFLVNTRTEQPEAAPLTLVQNWPATLRK
jgi:eukaryotic-like serine/threonine-protein kinase